MSKDLLLVGSIPLDTVEHVFGRFGRTLGGYLMSLPDGEVGLRRHWISRVHYQVLAIHPNIEILRHPRPDDGVERLFPHDASLLVAGFRLCQGGGARTIRRRPGIVASMRWFCNIMRREPEFYHSEFVRNYDAVGAVTIRHRIPG
jgi:hypothetical protein